MVNLEHCCSIEIRNTLYTDVVKYVLKYFYQTNITNELIIPILEEQTGVSLNIK